MAQKANILSRNTNSVGGSFLACCWDVVSIVERVKLLHCGLFLCSYHFFIFHLIQECACVRPCVRACMCTFEDTFQSKDQLTGDC